MKRRTGGAMMCLFKLFFPRYDSDREKHCMLCLPFDLCSLGIRMHVSDSMEMEPWGCRSCSCLLIIRITTLSLFFILSHWSSNKLIRRSLPLSRIVRKQHFNMLLLLFCFLAFLLSFLRWCCWIIRFVFGRPLTPSPLPFFLSCLPAAIYTCICK